MVLRQLQHSNGRAAGRRHSWPSDGRGAGVYASPALTEAAKAEAVVAAIYAKIPAICAATGPLVVDLQARYPRSHQLYRLKAAGTAICAAAGRPDNPINQARLIADALIAIEAAQKKLDAMK